MPSPGKFTEHKLRYSVKDCIELLGISRKHFYERVKTGRYKTITDGKRRFMTHEQLMAAVQGDPKPVCECEHACHNIEDRPNFDVKTPHGHKAHGYRIEVDKVFKFESPYGILDVCPSCASDCCVAAIKELGEGTVTKK